MKYTSIYPESALAKLELDKIRLMVASYCLSPLGLRYVERFMPSADYDFIVKALDQVDEFMSLHLRDEPFPTDHYHVLHEALNFLEIKNSVLSEDQFLQFMQFLRSMRALYSFFEKKQGAFPALQAVLRDSTFIPAPLKAIEFILSEEGTVKNGVSPTLDKIRKEIRHLERQLDKQFQNILLQAQEQGWLVSEGESLRNGRRVLAIQAEHKRRIRGIVHDESATGKTVFLEPEQTVEISNELFEQKQEEKREIYRILKKLSDDVRPHVAIIRIYQRTAGLFDFIRAKALLALQLKANKPSVSQKPVVSLTKAYHPLLLIHHQKQGKEIIPQSIRLDEENRILVISGPNAGGKSVSLKTIGLLQLMLQSGMLVPVNPDSEMGIFSKLFVEMGDEQSIENDLSTYSSHLQHMRLLLEQADGETLFLIDEFGTGTDPRFGGAIAEAVLLKLKERKAFGVVTTHYSNLKIFASETKGVINGSMLFDMDTLNPLYVLKIGQPGSSHAFEIAKKIGLPEDVIRKAESKVDKNYQDFDSLLATLETDKHLLEIQQQRLETDQKELDGLIKSYTQLKEDLDKNKQKIILENKQKALQEVEQTNRKMEQLLKEINQKTTEKSSGQKIRKEIQHKRTELKQEIETLKEKFRPKKEKKEIKIGSKVRVGEGQEVGRVEEIRNNKALVAFHSLKTLVSIKELEVVEEPTYKPSKKVGNIDYAAVSESFTPTLDLRGKRADEALREVESQLDKALLLSYPSLRILHGKGDGILRKMIRELLAKYDFIKEFHSETEEFGGEGVTLVELK